MQSLVSSDFLCCCSFYLLFRQRGEHLFYSNRRKSGVHVQDGMTPIDRVQSLAADAVLDANTLDWIMRSGYSNSVAE